MDVKSYAQYAQPDCTPPEKIMTTYAAAPRRKPARMSHRGLTRFSNGLTKSVGGERGDG